MPDKDYIESKIERVFDCYSFTGENFLKIGELYEICSGYDIGFYSVKNDRWIYNPGKKKDIICLISHPIKFVNDDRMWCTIYSIDKLKIGFMKLEYLNEKLFKNLHSDK